MEFLYDLSNIKRLDSIKEDKDIKQLSYAQFPGTHCPLFGSVMTGSYVKDLVILVVGTQECTYYAKDFANVRQKGKDNVISFVASKNDIVFGCQSKVEEAIIKIDSEMKPKAILVVTTCVIELIGEDFESIINKMKSKVDSKIMVVKTEHFKCNSHIPGIERTLEAFAQLMEPCVALEKTINILGYRDSGIENTEMYNILTKNGVKINMSIPSSSTIEGMYRAPQAKLNIVTDFTALKLAKKMKEKFNIEYIYFDKTLNLDKIEESYRNIEKVLNIDLSEDIKFLREKSEKVMNKGRELLNGKRFIYGNSPMNAFELSGFLCSLGMEPLIIQARELYENDNTYIEEIKSYNYNPYVSRIANIAPLRQFYDILEVDYYLGHENPMELMKRGIKQIVMDDVNRSLGFEVPINTVESFLKGKDMFSFMGKMGGGNNMPVNVSRMLEETDNKDNKNKTKEMEEIESMDFIPEDMKTMISKMDNIPPQMLKAMKMMKFAPSGMMNIMKMMHMKGGKR